MPARDHFQSIETYNVVQGGSGTLPDQTGATSTTVILDAGASAVDDAYNGWVIVIAGGDTRTITDYDGTSKTATVSVAWGTQPVETDTYTSGNSVSFKVFPYGNGTVTAEINAGVAPDVYLEATNEPSQSPQAWSAIASATPVADGTVLALNAWSARYLWYRLRSTGGDGSTDVDLYLHRWRSTSVT